MNIQQLEYIIAVERFRHFAKAAEHCGVTQPTLSMMVKKLEEELEVEIFDRRKNPIEPTPIGKRLIKQSKSIELELNRFVEIAQSVRDSVEGELYMAIIPTLAPYILPPLFEALRTQLSSLKFSISECRTSEIINDITNGNIELAILATPLNEPDIFELPLFYERFIAYVSPKESEMYGKDKITFADLDSSHIWLLQEGHCFRNQMINICQQRVDTNQRYEAGTIDTLIKVVDANGGYTLIPELHIPSLTQKQRKNLRYFAGDEPRREVSFVFREDFAKERLINELVEIIKRVIPPTMLESRLSKFRVTL